MACTGCGSILINYSGDGSPTGEVGSSTETYWNKADFSQPTGLDKAGFGNTGRTSFRRPAVWNVDLGFFKAFPIGRFRPEIRFDIANIFNHTNWGAPNTSFTSPLFLTFAPAQRRERHEHTGRPPHAARPPRASSSSSRRGPAPCPGRASLSGLPSTRLHLGSLRASGTRDSGFRWAGGSESRRPFSLPTGAEEVSGWGLQRYSRSLAPSP